MADTLHAMYYETNNYAHLQIFIFYFERNPESQ